MLKIGDFSKLSRVSIRMLRHYDDIGLLKPAEIDHFTGYRYYREDQLFVISRITALKDMGFALADIVRILEVYDDKDRLDTFLTARQKELEAQAKETEYKMMLLDSARNRLRKEKNMGFDVTVKTIPERYAPCYAIAEFLDDEYKEENVEIIVSMSVKGKYQDTEHVKFRTLPPVKVASCIVKGSYQQMGEAYATVVSWINDNGYRTNGPMFNIYHVGPGQTQNPDEFVTEVCFPVE